MQGTQIGLVIVVLAPRDVVGFFPLCNIFAGYGLTKNILAIADNIPLKNLSQHIEPAITPAAALFGCTPNQGARTEHTDRSAVSAVQCCPH